jgi:hypothetical protein
LKSDGSKILPDAWPKDKSESTNDGSGLRRDNEQKYYITMLGDLVGGSWKQLGWILRF